MIREDEVFKIGIINKPHGVKGELMFTFTDDIFDRTDCDYLVLLTDGILVPFFIEEYRFRSDTAALIKFEGIDDADQAKRFTNTEVFFPLKYVDDDDEEPTSWSWFHGFSVDDVNLGHLGKIVDVDDTTINVLFVIESPAGEEILIPAHEEFIVDIDKKKRLLTVKTPEGLIER